MRIAIISDTHDNIWKLEKAMPHLASSDVLLHCGDICSPFVIRQLGEGLKGVPAHVVWGNNDGDKRLLADRADEAGNITMHGDFAELEFGGLKVAVNHYPEIGRALAGSGHYGLVCYGHDHTAYEERVGETLLLNPGELLGMKGRSTLAIYDTKKGEVEWVEVK